MAKKTPLSFLVQVEMKTAMKKLDDLEQKLNNLKKNVTITIDTSGGGDLDKLVENIGKAAGSIAAAKEAIKRDTFTGFASRVEKAATAINNLENAFSKFNATIGKDEGLKNFMTGLGEVIRAARAALPTLTPASGSASGIAASIDKSIEQAKYELYKVTNLMQRAGNAASIGSIFGDTSKLNAQIALVEQYRKTLEELKRTGTSAGGLDTAAFKAQGDYKIAIDELKRLITLQEKSNQENIKTSAAAGAAAGGVRTLANEENRLWRAVQQSTDSMKQQSQVLSDLKSLATQYLGVWGAQGFLKNIIQIGGQLEQQRLSIGAILGDFSAGTHLFEQIKALAVQSPFGVVELDKYTKQLSAYGFKQNELFDMTKRLADISAGAGTDVGRLALALGHVRSEGALTGYTLRQFAMNNVPMLQKLSDRLTEIEGRIVSASEIRKRVSNKEIGYEDVIAVMKDLTDEGGMFYNMQEVMSQAVSAKFKNLKDSMDIMYGEMAESKIGDVLKTIAQSLMTVTRNWESSLRVIGYATAAWVGHRVAIAATSKGLGQFGFTLASTNQKLMAQRIIYGGNNAALKSLSASTVDLMVKQKLLTKEQLLNAVATKRLTVGQAELAAANFNVARSELMMIAGAGKWRLMLGGLITSIRGVGIALKGMLFNPVMIAFTAIAGAFEIFSRWKQKNEEIEESIAQLGQKGTDGYKNLADAVNKLPQGKMTNTDYKTSNDDILEQLQNYAPDINIIKEHAYSIDDLAKRYEYLKGELIATRNAYAKLEQIKNFGSDANEFTGDWVNDTFTENAEDYVEKLKDVSKAESNFYAHRASIDKALETMQSKYGFKMATNEDGTIAPIEEQIRLIQSSKETYAQFSAILTTTSQAAGEAWSHMNGQLSDADDLFKNSVLPDLQAYAAGIDSRMAAKFGDDWKNSTENVKAAWMVVRNDIEKVPGMTEEVKNKLLSEIFNREWHLKIKVDTGEVEEKLPKWMQDLQDELDKTPIRLKTGMSYEQIVDAMKKAHKTAQTTIDSLGGIIMKAGIQISAVKGMDIEKYRYLNPELYAALSEMQAAVNSQSQIETAGAKRGIKFDEPSKKKGNKKTGSKGTKKDTVLEGWKTEYNELKAFYQAYKKLAEEMSGDKALEIIRGEGVFGQFFKDGNPIYDLDNWEDVLSKFLAKTDGKDAARKNFQTSIMKDILGVKSDNIKKELDKAAKEMQEYVNKNSGKFNLYKQIFEKTGDKGLASQAFADGRIWDDAARAFRDKLEEVTGESGIDFDMTDEEAKEHFKGMQGAYELWKQIVDITSKNYTDALSKAADAQASIMTNEEKIAVLQEKINDALADQSGIDHSAELSKWREEINKLESEMFEFLPIYEQIFGDKTYKSWGALDKAEELADTLINNAKEGSRNPKTGKVDYYTTYYMDENGMQKVTMTRNQLERLKKTIDGFHKDKNAKDPFSTLYDDIKNLNKVLKDDNSTLEDKKEAWRKLGDAFLEVSKIVSNLAGTFSEMADALGNEGLADALGDVQAGLNSVNNIAEGFAKGGTVGGIVAVVSEAAGWVTRLAQKHDKKLDKAIQKSAREVKKLQYAYESMMNTIERRLTGIYGGDEYDDMFANYKKQLAELEKQRKDEDDKKKTDLDKLLDYDQQIADMRNTIKYFAEDMAKDLYDIDVKSWAQELTDAVVDAWASGEDAAEAWHDKVLDLVKDVTKNILAQKVVEAALKPALDFITDEMTAKNGKLDESSITQMAKLLEEAGITSVSNIESVLEALKAAGYDMSDSGKSSSSSSSIKNITEETADLLVSYVNAIRADVSVIRELQTRGLDYISEVPTISITAQAQLQQLNMISENTRKNAEFTYEINNLFRGLKNGTWRLPVS